MSTGHDTKLRLSGVVGESVVDGPGFRMTIFVQGCPHACKGCHNPQTHDENGGYLSDINNIYEQFLKNSLLSGITFSGGEPFLWASPLCLLAEKIHSLGKSVWTYTGYTIEEVIKQSSSNPDFMRLLKSTDVLIDGRFVLERKVCFSNSGVHLTKG